MPRDQIFTYTGKWSNYKPFRLAKAEGQSLSWLGGSPPTGITPPDGEPEAKYLGTLRLEGEKSVSIFTTVDFYSGPGPLSPWQKPIYTEQDRLVQFVVHEPRDRPEFVAGAIYDPRPADIEFGPVGDDGEELNVEVIYDSVACVNDRIYAGHKSGGIPTFYQMPDDIIEAAVETLDEEFFHLLQLYLLDRDDTESSKSYEFGEYIFHVYVKEIDTAPYLEFRYHWG